MSHSLEDYVIYDLEIEKAILKQGEQPLPGIEYCAGWQDHENMGISVLCAYSVCEQRFVFCDNDNKEEFVQLCSNKIAVGFNNMKFDNAVIRATWGERYVPPHRADILLAIWKSLNLDVDNFVFQTHGGYNLDAMAEKNIGKKKTGHGAFAPVLWQQHKFARLYNYCLNDVAITYRLLKKIIQQGGSLISPKNGETLDLRLFFP